MPTIVVGTADGSPPQNAADRSRAVTARYGGRYELLDLVGAGGAGTVYRARDVELDEVVALKVLRHELIRSQAVIERFRSEVKLARRVTHRNVARMFDIGEQEGERFLTMEFVEGEMLSARIASGPQGSPRALSLPTIVDVTTQICAGLGAAHAVGVIHRDLKPDNVILGRDGRVVITDFGIARALQPSETTTAATNEFIGTPEYMSPEQAEGGAIDLRTDIYSLGVMLYEMMTGALPFTGATPLITAAARLLKPPPDPRLRRPELTEELAQVVLRCLARQRQDRFASAQEVADALAAACESIPLGRSGAYSTVPGTRTSSPQTISKVDSGPIVDGRLGVTASLTSQGLGGDSTAMSVAVLPFRNQGPPADEYLADGLTDDLTDSLSMVAGLRVRSRAAVVGSGLPLTGDPLALGRGLGVQVLVDGTVRRLGELLRIAARLVRVEDGSQIWAQRFDRPAADALQVSDEVAGAVATALTGGAAAPQRHALGDAEAVDLYLRGRALFQRGDRQSVAESVRLLEQALALRPNDPTLLTTYAQAQGRQWFFGGEGVGEKARAAAEKAVAVAPERAESHVALATVCFHLSDAPGAVRELRLALKQAPGLVDAHDLLGRILIESGPVNIGLRHLDFARQQEPNLRRNLIDRSRVCALLGDWDTCHRLLDEALSSGLPLPAVWMLKARFLLWRRDTEQAIRLLEHPDLTGEAFTLMQRVLEIVANRRHIEPADLFDGGLGGESSSPRGRTFFFQLSTELYAFYGETDSAFRTLARAVDLGFFDLGWFDCCPAIAELRADLRFHALRRVVAGRVAQVHEALR